MPDLTKHQDFIEAVQNAYLFGAITKQQRNELLGELK